MSIQILPVHVDGEITRGQDIVQAAKGLTCVQKGDVVVFSQKIISKQEGRIVLLDSVMPGSLALGIASAYSKDPRTIQLVLDESSRIVRMRSGVLIMQTHSGLVCANAGVDESNVPLGYAALLPENPDASAILRESILQKTGKETAVVISERLDDPSAWARQIVSIGSAGIAPIKNYAGSSDAFGRILRLTARWQIKSVQTAELALKKDFWLSINDNSIQV